jgi:Zn-dependent protease
MVASRQTRSSIPIHIGPGGLAPAVAFAVAFAALAPSIGLPIWIAALLGGIGGTTSLLVHELGHARAAQRLRGIHAASISLIWLGAASRFEGRYLTGREQTRVAIAGPRASFGLALFLAGSCFLPMPLAVKEAVLVLAIFNVAIGVLNLVPAHPLDGHKLVVGLLWWATGCEKRARRIIRRIGLGCAAVEIPSVLFLLVDKPPLGVGVVVTAASFIAQRRLCGKPSA